MVATTLLNVEPSKGKLEIQRMFDFEMTSHCGLLAPVVLNSLRQKRISRQMQTRKICLSEGM